MLQITIQDLLQGKLDESNEDYKIYLISEKDEPGRQHINHFTLIEPGFPQYLLTLFNLDLEILNEAMFYIGQTKRNPKERMYEHLFKRGQSGQSNVGKLIIQNLPTSMSWTVRLLTLRDAEQFLLNYTRAKVVQRIFELNEIYSKLICGFLDSLPQLFPESPSEVQRIKDQFQDLSFSSSSATRSIIARAQTILISLDKTFEDVLPDFHEQYPDNLLLERFYNPQYAEKVSKFLEWYLIKFLDPYLNKNNSASGRNRSLSAKYITSGIEYF
jgi:hypothetical protein